MNIAVALTRSAGKTLTATVTVAAASAIIKVRQFTLAATISTAATFTRQTGKVLQAV